MANKKVYDLEERTFEFAKDIGTLVKSLSATMANIEDGKQVGHCREIGLADVTENL